jgi:hypothetical protein
MSVHGPYRTPLSVSIFLTAYFSYPVWPLPYRFVSYLNDARIKFKNEKVEEAFPDFEPILYSRVLTC